MTTRDITRELQPTGHFGYPPPDRADDVDPKVTLQRRELLDSVYSGGWTYNRAARDDERRLHKRRQQTPDSPEGPGRHEDATQQPAADSPSPVDTPPDQRLTP